METSADGYNYRRTRFLVSRTPDPGRDRAALASCVASCVALFVPLFVAAAVLVAATLADVAAAGPAAAARPNRASALTAAIKQVMRQTSIPGVIVGVWQPGVAPYVKAFGVRNKATGRPMTTDLHLRIGSETKTFTITAVLQLVDQGKVGLDDPIGNYLSGVPNGNEITIRQLAEMRSGLVSYTTSEAWSQAYQSNPLRPWTPQELLPYSFSQPLLFAPGTQFNYSNTNTILLGLLVEKVSGQSLSAFISQHILKAEGLTHTSFPAGAAIPSPYAQGYSKQTPNGKLANVTKWNPAWAWAAGSMISTIADLHTWARVVATGTLLTPATQQQREVFLPVVEEPPMTYGLALFNINGWLGHNGSIPGYQSLTVYLPSSKATMVVLMNTDANPPDHELTTVVGRAITKIITPKHIFYFSKADSGSAPTTTAPPAH